MRAGPSVERGAVVDLSAYVSEPLWKDGDVMLSRGVGTDEPPSLLLLAPVRVPPGPATLARLERAWALRDVVDSAWATRPLGLVHHQGCPTLVLENPGGELLARLVGPPWEPTRFLRIAIGLAGALRRLHACGLVHKDVKPTNVLVDSATGGVWLTGFTVASVLPRELQAAAPPGEIAGTLAYMAPEQTGLVNRSVDSRSDLYAFGVTLYEMLTGSVPFTVTDPAELIHCHVARQPPPLDGHGTTIPRPIAAIVAKLLEKNAEDRYQTAAGVEADLRRCLAAGTAAGRMESFALGSHDVSDQLRLPEKLYGRQRDVDRLLAAFDRVAEAGTAGLILVSGHAGVGKSSLVRELQAALIAQRGLFAGGKFGQYKRDVPYAPLAQAFQSLVRSILGQPETELASWRHAIEEAVGPNGQ